MIRYFFIVLFGISTSSVFANQVVDISIFKQSEILAQIELTPVSDNTEVQPKFQKLKVVLLTIFLGHFGVHRIYLGTSPNVPVVYSLTLGGGLGLLPLCDLIAILTTDDLSQFRDNNRVFMWNKKSAD